MHIYMASVYSHKYQNTAGHTGLCAKLTPFEKSRIDSAQNFLESYHYVNKPQFVSAMRADNAKVFIDSGAFSAHTLGAKINIRSYVDFLLQNDDIIRVDDGIKLASVLDGIGDPLTTFQNQKIMEDLGFTPLPCYHYGEDERYLDYYINNYEYITIGGMVGKSFSQLNIWLDRIFNKYLMGSSGNLRVKVHGFGITSNQIIDKYPWYSCDSSSWTLLAAYGHILIPDVGVVTISDKSTSRFSIGRHITNFTQIEKELIFNKLEEQGFDYQRLATIYEVRSAYNLWAYGVINDAINSKYKPKYTSAIQELF